jgi:exosortase/archaeosortase family protein
MHKRLSPGVGFSLRFFGYLLLFSIGFWLFSLHEHLGPVQRAIASLSTVGQHWVGGHAVSRGDDIVIDTMTVNVNHECTGIFVFMLFISFVLAYPAPWTGRLGGLAIGIPLIFAVNVLRLATLARVVEIYPQAFFYLHEYVWQGIFTVLVLVGAISWAERFE